MRRGAKPTRIKEGKPIILVCIACGEILSGTMAAGIVCPLCDSPDVRLQAIGDDDEE